MIAVNTSRENNMKVWKSGLGHLDRRPRLRGSFPGADMLQAVRSTAMFGAGSALPPGLCHMVLISPSQLVLRDAKKGQAPTFGLPDGLG